MHRVAALMGLAAGLCAEVAGTPMAPRPGTLPRVWFSWTNDAISGEIGDNTDDFRTSAFEFQARLWKRLIFCIDHSTLTDKRNAANPTARADEGTATIGWLLNDRSDRVSSAWLAPGVGIRHYGNMGGEAVQNAWHKAIAVDQVDYLNYDQSDTVGVVYLAGGWTLPILAIPSMPFLQRGQLALALNGQGMLTTASLAQGTTEVDLAALGQDGGIWFGLRLSGDHGDQQGPTARRVSDHETGYWVTYGISAGGWFITGAVDPESRAATGRVGWQWLRGQGRDDDGSRALMAGELTVLPGPGLGATLRWQPVWLRESWLGDHGWLNWTYHFGRTGVTWDNNVVVFDQATLGLEITGNSTDGPGCHWEPYANSGFGVRSERVVVRGDFPRYEPERSTTPVLSAGVGMRAVWGPRPAGNDTARYGIGLGLEGWLPFESERIDNGVQSDHYNTPGFTIGMSVTVLAQW